MLRYPAPSGFVDAVCMSFRPIDRIIDAHKYLTLKGSVSVPLMTSLVQCCMDAHFCTSSVSSNPHLNRSSLGPGIVLAQSCAKDRTAGTNIEGAKLCKVPYLNLGAIISEIFHWSIDIVMWISLMWN